MFLCLVLQKLLTVGDSKFPIRTSDLKQLADEEESRYSTNVVFLSLEFSWKAVCSDSATGNRIDYSESESAHVKERSMTCCWLYYDFDY